MTKIHVYLRTYVRTRRLIGGMLIRTKGGTRPNIRSRGYTRTTLGTPIPRSMEGGQRTPPTEDMEVLVATWQEVLEVTQCSTPLQPQELELGFVQTPEDRCESILGRLETVERRGTAVQRPQ